MCQKYYFNHHNDLAFMTFSMPRLKRNRLERSFQGDFSMMKYKPSGLFMFDCCAGPHLHLYGDKNG